MPTKFLCMTCSQFSITHTTKFESKGAEYELVLNKVCKFNLSESTLDYPENYIFSVNGCWEISFDLVDNIENRTPFSRPVKGKVNSVAVIRTVERIIFDHYNEFKAGMYVFLPDDDRLETVYRRLLISKFNKGFTLEIGLKPDGRGHVLRTPYCY
ncbi:hypothetical protein AKG16_09625 [Morganella morganii]|nr:hypothetical protein AKG16_09625 [Morganella morganii]